jgi:hypothetical protein
MQLHRDPSIRWLDDRLPSLVHLRELGLRFDCLLLSGVWQHLTPAERERAMPNLAALLAGGGKLILSLRHGPGASNRPCYAGAPEETIAAAMRTGLAPELRREAESIQAANRRVGVTWTWLVFRGATTSDSPTR